MKATADVVVIGGGCMGASVAYHLARLGVTDVALVEREPLLGTGSTGRNAGGVRHQFSHDANIRLSVESIAFLERFQDIVGTEIDFHQDGYLFLLTTAADVAAFREGIERQRRHGLPVDWLGAADAIRIAPGLVADDVVAATYCARDGIADPNGVTQGFAKAAQARGVRVWRETEVVGVRRQGGRVLGVETTRGPIDAPIVVNAAGPWAKRIGAMAGLAVPVEPCRRHIFIAAPPTGTGWERSGPTGGPGIPLSRVMVIDFATTFYFHREGGNLLFGMGDRNEPPGFDVSVDWEFLDRVAAVAIRRLPALEEAPVSHAWAGLYEMTPDAMPIVGPARALTGFFLIAGFSGHGFQHSPAAGRILADLIAGRDPQFDLRSFELERFETGPAAGEGNVV